MRSWFQHYERFATLRRLLAALSPPAAIQDRPRHWPRSWRHWIAARLLLIAALLLLGLALVSLFTVAWTIVAGKPPIGLTMSEVSDRCDRTGFACTVATSIFFTVGPIAVGSFVFLFWRFRRVTARFIATAKDQPAQLVETAGDIVGTVVGRDDICNVLQEDLRDREGRRPHVLVGGVGAGKTAVLVRLTEQLARRGAVPVPIRLRDATEEVDFLDLARDRFIRGVEGSLLSEAEGEKVWRRLRKNDQVVVLADGLEEALADDPAAARERDHRIRVAVRHAHRRKYPLVIASRPHDALHGLDAAMVQLEPLSEKAALEYIRAGKNGGDDQRLAWVLQTAEAVETPLYLQIARDLNANGLLSSEGLDTRGADRVKLRVKLMERWIGALIDGTLEEAAGVRLTRVALSMEEREATVLQLSALACCGLAEDTLQVKFSTLEGTDPGMQPLYPDFRAAVAGELGRSRVDAQLAASMGARLGLVEQLRDGVRFPHSIMQAYLGSRLMGRALRDPRYEAQAFRDPGREFLVALVMFSRAEEAKGEGPQPGKSWLTWLRQRLIAEATGEPAPRPEKALDLLAAAVEIDSLDPSSKHEKAPGALAGIWTRPRLVDDAVQDATLKAVSRLGEAARHLRHVHHGGGRFVSTAVRRARSAGGTQTAVAVAERSVESGERSRGLFQRLYDVCCMEELYPVRLAAAQEIGTGGADALRELRPELEAPVDTSRLQAGLSDAEAERKLTVQAWLLPMLVGSCGDDEEGQTARRWLDNWLNLVGNGMPLSIEAALAQGFKYAANRRPRHPYERAETRSHLTRRAGEMLRSADFWFSRLTLLHALCLWRLAGSNLEPGNSDGGRGDLRAVVERWSRRPGGEPEHRFVREAAGLVLQALRTRHPERFIWIDESGVVTTVGSRSGSDSSNGLRNLWIPPSAGWVALDPRAQQLVADVLILLNLAERGGSARGRERRLHQANAGELPYCLKEERCDHLMPARSIGVTQDSPRDECKGGCPVELCPYPAKGKQPYRVELSEAFCRNQRSLLSGRRHFGGRAPWQDAPRSELKQFWTEMEERARA